MLPLGTSVTFDTNTLDKAARPERHPKDPAQANFQKVHEALRTGRLRGFVSETVVTLEGIKRADRARVFGSTYLAARHTEPEVQPDGMVVHRVNLETTQPHRHPFMKKMRAALPPRYVSASTFRLRHALQLPRIDDPEKTIYVYEDDEQALETRLDRFFNAARAIAARGFGMVLITKIAARLAN